MFYFDSSTLSTLRQACFRIFEHRGAQWWNAQYDSYFATLVSERGFTKCTRALAHDLNQLKMDFAGKKVLDAGFGSGMLCIVLALLGASEVYGVEVWDGALTFATGVLRDVFKNELPIKLLKEDAAKTSFPDTYFDAIFCREAISHFRAPYAFLDETARILKPGGKLFISDGNNGCNPLIRARTYKIWERMEKGPPGRFYCHDIPEPFEDVRRRIISENFPELSPSDVNLLAVRTFQMSASQVKEAVAEFLSKGVMPNSLYERGKCPVDVETGMFEEQLFSPFELADYLRRIGMHASVYAYFSHGRHPVLAAISRLLARISSFTIYFAPTFQITATKLNSRDGDSQSDC